MRLSCTVTEIWRFKDNGVTSLTFGGHVTSSVTWAFDSREPSSYGWSIVTIRPSGTVSLKYWTHGPGHRKKDGRMERERGRVTSFWIVSTLMILN